MVNPKDMISDYADDNLMVNLSIALEFINRAFLDGYAAGREESATL